MAHLHTHRIPALLALALAMVSALAGVPAYAADEAETYSAVAAIADDGALKVDSTITFPDGAPEGLQQRIRLEEPALQQRTRHYEVSDVVVTADGKPAGGVQFSQEYAVVDVNAPGAREVTIGYRVTGASAPAADDRTTVRWELLQGLSVPVQQVTAELDLPGQFTDFQCFAGVRESEGSCVAAEGMPHAGTRPSLTDGPRAAEDVVGVQLTFPEDVVAADQQVSNNWTVGRAFSATGWPLVAALATLLAGALALFLLHRKAGRDAHPGGAATPVGMFVEDGQGHSTFQLLDNVRPGEVGTVVDERVDPVDITASILDLAVRGHLQITEQPRSRNFSGTDWVLRRGAGGEPLRAYERALLDSLTPVDGSSVAVSRLGDRVMESVEQVQSELYDEVVDQGWFAHRPDTARTVIGRIALGLLVVGILATIGLAAFTGFGLTGVAVILIAIGLAAVAQEMPARKAAGSRLLAGLNELREELRNHPTDRMPPHAAYREISRVLPYAVVLGGYERWLQALVDVAEGADPTDAEETVLSWFHGPDGWELEDLPDSLRNFVTTVNGYLYAR